MVRVVSHREMVILVNHYRPMDTFHKVVTPIPHIRHMDQIIIQVLLVTMVRRPQHHHRHHRRRASPDHANRRQDSGQIRTTVSTVHHLKCPVIIRR